MNLQAKETTWIAAVVDPVRNGHTIDPGLYDISLCRDREAIPTFTIKRCTSFFMFLSPDRVEISAATLAIDTP